MPKRNKNPWPRRRRQAVQIAEELVAKAGNAFPTRLGPIAAARLVRRIEFKPLLIDGGLAVHDNGFVIYVKSEPGEAEDFTARFLEDETGTSLPSRTVRRARFTIAHEIAHTLFYDLREKPPRLKIKLDDEASFTGLELTCNEVAGVLLLPEPVLQREYSETEFARPEDIRRLADKALVSSQTVIRRFQQLRRFAHPEAILATVTQRENQWLISAISRHYSLRSLFTGAKVGAPLQELVSDPDFLLFGGEMSEVVVTFIGHGGRKTSMLFACEPRSKASTIREIIVCGSPVR